MSMEKNGYQNQPHVSKLLQAMLAQMKFVPPQLNIPAPMLGGAWV